jgi:phenylalanyl-tRNA synthetase alpha chain
VTTRLSSHDLEVALELRYLSGPAGGPHAMQALPDDVLVALTGACTASPGTPGTAATPPRR